MEASKRKKISTIIGIVYSALMLITFALYFLPYYTFPVAHTEGVYDHDAKTCTITVSVKEAQNSLAGFLWFPAEAAGGHYLDAGSLSLRYELDANQQYEGYELIIANPDEFVAEKDYFTQTTTYIENEYLEKELAKAKTRYGVDSLEELYDYASMEEGVSITKVTELYDYGYLGELGINMMVTFPVIQMVAVLVLGIICAFLCIKPFGVHLCYLPILAGLVGIVCYLTQFSVLLGPTTIYLIMSVLITLAGAANIYFSVANIREWKAKRNEILVKMGLK